MKVILSILLLFLPFLMKAQEIEMADQMRANGKIYVVVAVLLIILLGLLFYLISMDRKINRLEKEIDKK